MDKNLKNTAYLMLKKAKQDYKNGSLFNKRALQLEVLKRQESYNLIKLALNN
jgi:hypothetical protein